jgi:oxygen-dependent protoporphyrinogen oxidase
MRVAVVGAGITGLALTHHLAERGIDSITYEADDQAGGVIRSQEIDGRTVEVGPQRLRLTPGVRDIVDDVGLSEAVIEAGEEHLYVYSRGKLREAPLDRDAFIRTDLLSWPEKLRLLAEPLTRQGMREETAAELFTRKFGRQAYERFIGPLYGGIYGSDPAEMPANFALDGLLKREEETGSFLRAFLKRVGQGQNSPPISFEGGNQRLPAAIAERYDGRLELDTPVQSIRHADESSTAMSEEAATATDGGQQYVVETPVGTETFDQVVVTTPADVTASLLADVAEGTDGLASLNYNPLAMVHLDAECDREGFGYQVAYGEDLHTLGASWNDSMFGRENLYTVFLGGMHEPEMVERPPAEIGEIAAREFEQVMGSPVAVLNVTTREKWFPAYDRSWYALDDFEAPEGITLATNYTARMGIPSRVREAKEVAETLAEAA